MRWHGAGHSRGLLSCPAWSWQPMRALLQQSGWVRTARELAMIGCRVDESVWMPARLPKLAGELLCPLHGSGASASGRD